MDPAVEGLSGRDWRWKAEKLMTYSPAYSKVWYAANKERLRTIRKAWNEANKEKRAASNKALYGANKERVNAASRAWYAANKEHANAGRRARDLINRPERFRKAYDPNHPYGPKQLLDGEWVRLERSECTFLRASDTSPAAHLAAALIVIDERLAEGGH
jgi:hypothetical protein